MKKIVLIFSLLVCCLVAKAQLAENSIMTVKELMELAKEDNFDNVKKATEAKGYKSRGGKSLITKCFVKDCVLNGSNLVTAVNNVNTGSTVNYASDDGAISVDVFTIANRDELIKEMEELEYVKTDSSETMDTYRKDGEMSLFNLIHYTVPGTNITGYTLLFNPFF